MAAWPQFDEALTFTREEAEFQKVMDLIKAIRNQRAEMNIPPGFVRLAMRSRASSWSRRWIITEPQKTRSNVPVAPLSKTTSTPSACSTSDAIESPKTYSARSRLWS